VPPHLFYCDLDGFKAINDSSGHQAGDDALVVVARTLEHLVRPHDTIARLGGDEFVVLCEDLADEDAPTVAARLRTCGGPSSTLQLSVGVHRAEPGCTAAQALGGADVAMYSDKLRRRAARR
jgi:diguanylate cyclase (GGDEF)-like protein